MQLALVLLTTALAAPDVAPAFEDEDGKGAGAAAQPGVWADATPVERAAQRALEEGLAFLAAGIRSSTDGSLPVGDAQDRAPVGVTALGALALMAAGNSPGRGPHGDEVARAVEYLLSHADLAPESDTYGYIAIGGDQWSRTHGHGYATLALAEAAGMYPRAQRLLRVLTAAVRRIEDSQGSEGGWYYEPRVTAQHEGSVTICYVQALRAARNSGVRVDGSVITGAEDYVGRLQDAEGLFRYQLDLDKTSVALTAAGIATLNAAGDYDSKAIQRGVDAIWQRLAIRDVDGDERVEFPYYERLYLAQAFWQLSDQSGFERWFPRERERIVREQEPDGSWPSRRHGKSYATAVNCLVLALPEGLLPIFQR